MIDDLVVIDSKDEGRVIRFYVINDEAGAPDREVLAMLKEIAIGTEVLVVAEGETLVHIEAHDTEDPVEPEEPEVPSFPSLPLFPLFPLVPFTPEEPEVPEEPALPWLP